LVSSIASGVVTQTSGDTIAILPAHQVTSHSTSTRGTSSGALRSTRSPVFGTPVVTSTRSGVTRTSHNQISSRGVTVRDGNRVQVLNISGQVAVTVTALNTTIAINGAALPLTTEPVVTRTRSGVTVGLSLGFLTTASVNTERIGDGSIDVINVATAVHSANLSTQTAVGRTSTKVTSVPVITALRRTRADLSEGRFGKRVASIQVNLSGRVRALTLNIT